MAFHLLNTSVAGTRTIRMSCSGSAGYTSFVWNSNCGGTFFFRSGSDSAIAKE